MKSEHNFGIFGFLAGAVVGATLGLLLAPQSGKETRKEIKRRAKKARKGFGAMVDDVKNKASHAAADAADEISAKAKRAADSVRQSAN